MKLLGLAAIVGWYLAARSLRYRQRTKIAADNWQVRCLNCQTIVPMSESETVANLPLMQTEYTMDRCKACGKVAGLAIEEKNRATQPKCN